LRDYATPAVFQKKDGSTSPGGHDNEGNAQDSHAGSGNGGDRDDRRRASEITHNVASRETISTPPWETVRPVHNRSCPREQSLHAPDERIRPRRGAVQLTTWASK
jgi:hypothetical protein